MKDGPKKKKDVEALTKKWIGENGWLILPMGRLSNFASFLVKKNNMTVLIKCSGTDRRTLYTDMRDLRQYCVPMGIRIVFIYGEEYDPRLIREVRAGNDILISADNLVHLQYYIDNLNPEFKGVVDHIVIPDILRGWVILNPFGHATIKAYHEGEVIGETIANIFRRDLTHTGDGCFGFELLLNKEFDVSDIYSKIIVKAFYKDKNLGTVHFWKGASASRK